MDVNAIKHLEKSLEALKMENRRLQARQQIENLMGRYAHLHAAGRDREILETLWSRQGTATLEDRFSGVYQLHGRISSISDYYSKVYGMPRDPEVRVTQEPGRMIVDALTSPVIEIAGDGLTARGAWICTGHESRVVTEPTGIPTVDAIEPDAQGRRFFAEWVWSRICADFALEDGEWRIRHMHIYDIMRCPFEQNWIAYAEQRCMDDMIRDGIQRFDTPTMHADFPTAFHWQYGPDRLPPEWLDLPEPYDHFPEE